MKKQLNLIYAVKDTSIVSIADVESGLRCGCICPACGEPLVARKGQIMMHHFAHYSGKNCAYGYESSLHLAAKDILAKAKKMTIPAVYVNFPKSGKKDELICAAKEIELERVELEKHFTGVVPDVVVYAGGKAFFVEIYVTHRIDDTKLDKLRQAEISTIEIDLSKKTTTISVEELTEILLGDSEEKQWKYNRISEKYFNYFLSVADERKIIDRAFTLHVEDCPIKARIWRGIPYANFLDDCQYCKFCVAITRDKIFCSGRSRIETISDF